MIYLVAFLSVMNLVLFVAFVWLFLSGRLELRTKKLIVIDQNMKRSASVAFCEINSKSYAKFDVLFCERY